jgi:RNA polymerase sigma-70 factor (ECF subfamily)
MLESAGASQGLGEAAILTFEEFFRATYTRLAQMLLLLTGERDEAEELAQEAMARVFERWDRVRGMASPDGYAYRTAVNLHRKTLRRAAVRRRIPFPRTQEVDLIAVATSRHDVRQALASLPRAQREALVLVEWLGLDAAEAGAILGIKSVSIHGRLHRARESLRKQLGGVE